MASPITPFMTDEKLRALWGDALFDYAYQASIDLVGYPQWQCMVMVAIGRLNDRTKGLIVLGLNV